MTYVVDESYRLRKMAFLLKECDLVLEVGAAQQPNRFLPRERTMCVDLIAPASACNDLAVWVRSRAEQLPVRPGSVDGICAGEILEHFERPMDFLRECQSALRPGGILVLSTPNPNSLIERTLTLSLNRKLFYTKDHVTLYPQRWLIRMLELAGFTEVRLYSGGFPVPTVGLIPFPRPWCHQTIVRASKPSE